MPVRQARSFAAWIEAYLSKVLQRDTSLHRIGSLDKQ